MTEKNRNIVIIVLAILALVLVGLKLEWFGGKLDEKYQKEERVGDTVFKYVKLDSQEVASVLPKGMPQNVPVETKIILESYDSQADRSDSLQSAFSYISKLNLEDNYKKYKEYMEKNQYTLKETKVDEKTWYLFGQTEAGELSVVISNATGATRVQLSYLAR